MSPAESILYEDMSEVHPGAGSVNILAGHGNSRYLYEMFAGSFGKQIEWNRVFTASILRGGFLAFKINILTGGGLWDL